ncbi:YgjV family protein [Vibrio sp. NTOU-M3]|uniref:YgjV family protein n=1 Tax=Vibrio sp. NTOU-M3 TaxID=3234954 RepID=UPI00349F6232
MISLDLAQLVGLLSFILGVCTFYQKTDRTLKIMMLTLNINHMVHYILLGAPVAALSSFLSGLRTFTSIKTNSLYIAGLFIVFGVTMGLYMATRWTDMLAIIGTSIGTYALFRLDGIKMRIAFLIGACFWLANNLVLGSIGGVLLEVTMIAVNLSTIYRLSKSKMNEVSDA